MPRSWCWPFSSSRPDSVGRGAPLSRWSRPSWPFSRLGFPFSGLGASAESAFAGRPDERWADSAAGFQQIGMRDMSDLDHHVRGPRRGADSITPRRDIESVPSRVLSTFLPSLHNACSLKDRDRVLEGARILPGCRMNPQQRMDPKSGQSVRSAARLRREPRNLGGSPGRPGHFLHRDCNVVATSQGRPRVVHASVGAWCTIGGFRRKAGRSQGFS